MASLTTTRLATRLLALLIFILVRLLLYLFVIEVNKFVITQYKELSILYMTAAE